MISNSCPHNLKIRLMNFRLSLPMSAIRISAKFCLFELKFVQKKYVLLCCTLLKQLFYENIEHGIYSFLKETFIFAFLHSQVERTKSLILIKPYLKRSVSLLLFFCESMSCPSMSSQVWFMDDKWLTFIIFAQ